MTDSANKKAGGSPRKSRAIIYVAHSLATDLNAVLREATDYVRFRIPTALLREPLTDDLDTRKTPILERPVGRRLPRLLHAGDHLVVGHIGATTANIADAVKVFSRLAKRGVVVHLPELRLVVDQGNAQDFLQAGRAHCENARRCHSDAVKQGLARSRRLGSTPGRVQVLTTSVRRRGKRLFRIDPKQFATAQKILHLQESGHSWRCIAAEVGLSHQRCQRMAHRFQQLTQGSTGGRQGEVAS